MPLPVPNDLLETTTLQCILPLMKGAADTSARKDMWCSSAIFAAHISYPTHAQYLSKLVQNERQQFFVEEAAKVLRHSAKWVTAIHHACALELFWQCVFKCQMRLAGLILVMGRSAKLYSSLVTPQVPCDLECSDFAIRCFLEFRPNRKIPPQGRLQLSP